MNHRMAQEPKKSSLHKQIDENLKRIYDDALNQDVPDRFKQLLNLLQARDKDK